MSPISTERLLRSLERLAGEKTPLETPPPEAALRLLDEGGSGLGYSQLNELLILLGLDRVTHSFFQFLVDGQTEYQSAASISSISALEEGIDRFRQLALLRLGNVKFAFKKLSRDAGLLESYVKALAPVHPEEFQKRHEPIYPINVIPGDRTYYLGYIVEGELRDRLKADPNNADARQEDELRKTIVEQGRQNHEAYLASDHLDVYVATSMRARMNFSWSAA